jgi:hypothetical protein
MRDRSSRLISPQGLRRADAEDLRRLLRTIASEEAEPDPYSFITGSEAICALAVRPGETARGMISALEAALSLPEDERKFYRLGLDELDGPMALPALDRRTKRGQSNE